MEVSQIFSLIEKIDGSSLSENIRDLIKYSAMSQEHRKCLYFSHNQKLLYLFLSAKSYIGLFINMLTESPATQQHFINQLAKDDSIEAKLYWMYVEQANIPKVVMLLYNAIPFTNKLELTKFVLNFSKLIQITFSSIINKTQTLNEESKWWIGIGFSKLYQIENEEKVMCIPNILKSLTDNSFVAVIDIYTLKDTHFYICPIANTDSIAIILQRLYQLPKEKILIQFVSDYICQNSSNPTKLSVFYSDIFYHWVSETVSINEYCMIVLPILMTISYLNKGICQFYLSNINYLYDVLNKVKLDDTMPIRREYSLLIVRNLCSEAMRDIISKLGVI